MFNIFRFTRNALAIFAVLATSAAPAVGSTLGFHEFLKDHHTQAIELPRLYEPIPKHDPKLSNGALVKLWETNQFDPILRISSVEVQLYEAVSHIRDVHPGRFDFAHPTLGKMMSDPTFFQYALYLYNLDPARFVHYHHQLVPVVRGYAMVLMQPKPGSGSGTGAQTVGPAPSSTSTISPPPSSTFSSGPPPQALTVPEPSSIVLMTLGLGFLGARTYRRRRVGPR